MPPALATNETEAAEQVKTELLATKLALGMVVPVDTLNASVREQPALDAVSEYEPGWKSKNSPVVFDKGDVTVLLKK